MCGSAKPSMGWKKFILLGEAKGERWTRELARIRKGVARPGAAKLVFIRAENRPDDDNDDINNMAL
jgi:hypothetical protein